MDLHDALSQIDHIRSQVARTEVFRGYRALPVAISGFLAVAAGIVQAFTLPEPTEALTAYFRLWLGAAGLSLLATGATLCRHFVKTSSPLRRQATILAVGQFAPCLAAGGILFWVILHHSPENLWMLPGLWCFLFGLGVFASYRLLPRQVFWVGVHYFACGVLCLMCGQGENVLAPWTMAVPFGVGQFLAAAILYWTLERPDEGTL